MFLKLHPYKQALVHLRKNAKLSVRFFGPFKIIEKISFVAYKLELPSRSCIHHVFHVSLLKRRLGGEQIALPQLPAVLEDDRISLKPQAVLEKRMRNKKSEVLVHWQGLSLAEATWEDQEFIQKQFPKLPLRTRELLVGGMIRSSIDVCITSSLIRRVSPFFFFANKASISIRVHHI